VNRRDAFDLLALGAIWGAAFMFIRIAVPHFGPIALVEVRVVLAALVIIALVVLRGRVSEFKGRWKEFAIIGALNTAVPFALFAYATRTIPAGFAAVLNSSTPLWGAVIGRAVFGERLGVDRTVGLLVGFCGVVILVVPKLTVGGGALAISAALAGAALYAMAAHLTRRLLPGVSSLTISGGSLVASAAMLALPALWLRPTVMPPMSAWWSVIALALAGTALGYILYFRLLDSVGATGAMAVTYLIPLFGMVWGWMFLDEVATTTMLLGCACILAGVAVTTGMLTRWRTRAT
jgi:drug/metabolite transporter (DMT)-like permease